MKITKPSSFILILLFAFTASAQSPFRIVGYYSIDVALKAKPNKLPFKRLTHVNLWFFNPDTLGNFTKDLSKLKPFIAKAHTKNVKVLFSIAGGSPHPYYHTLLDSTHRTAFVNALVSQTLLYGVDGIDVDIEGRDIDSNYEAFVIELAAALRKENKLITAAIAVYYKDQLSDKALAQYDFVNIMSYDRTGPWRPHEPGPHSDMKAAESDITYFQQIRGIPKEKMTLGLPFYGYGFGPDAKSKATSKSYSQIIRANKGAEKTDEVKSPDGQTFYYNGIPTIIRKTKYAIEHASGVMIWQLRGDAKGRKSLLKVIYKTSRERN